jgi:hypothetical protein
MTIHKIISVAYIMVVLCIVFTMHVMLMTEYILEGARTRPLPVEVVVEVPPGLLGRHLPPELVQTLRGRECKS